MQYTFGGFYKDKKILVTGGGGFIGSHLVDRLIEQGADVSILGRNNENSRRNLNSMLDKITYIEGDARNFDDANRACKGIDIVFNLAMKIGGIEYNKLHPATTLRDNLQIAQSMIEAARLNKVTRFLVVSSACVYSANCSVPTKESEGFLGEPEDANAGYGWAKRIAEKLGEYYSREYHMNIAVVRPYNCYGPRDHFEPSTNVIPALIKRVFDGENPLVVWGSGKQTRSFLYVDDVVEGMMLAVLKNHGVEPINLGTDEEISIADLAKLIVELSGITTSLIFDTSKPDGALRRNCDNTLAVKKLGFKANTKLIQGLKKTIEWYRQTINK